MSREIVFSDGRFYKSFMMKTPDGAELFTKITLPNKDGKFPVVVSRCPYVDSLEDLTEDELLARAENDNRGYTDAGFAVVYQHCRGRGQSTGDCIPYVNERADGLQLLDLIRSESFYNGSIYLVGGSYLSSVHYCVAPFAKDVKGAVLNIQDTERYNVIYRNGFFKSGLHGSWYVGMYKRKSHLKKNFSDNSFDLLPLSDFSKTVLGEPAADLDETLRHPKADDPFWNTHLGGVETRHALDGCGIPILMATRFYDIYTGGIFDMWRRMDEKTKSLSALVVGPYDHSGKPDNQPVEFPEGDMDAHFGSTTVRWLSHIEYGTESPFPVGKVTYYRLFDNKWDTSDFKEDFADGKNPVTFKLGEGSASYVYNPYDPPHFKGGLSRAFAGTAWQDKPGARYDILTYYSDEFSRDTFIHGRMHGSLTVSSDCEDTCFYVRLSLVKEEGDYGLRDEIQQISNVCPDYVPGDKVRIPLSFDDHAFLVRKGEKLRIDIASACRPYYVRHTNNRGLFSEQTTARVAHNTVYLDESEITYYKE